MSPPVKNQPPTLATFEVPLNFNKLDMRDYLYNLYRLPTLSVRSFVRATPAGRPCVVRGGRSPEADARGRRPTLDSIVLSP